jgi:PAS domain S-box-containing protein
VTEPIHLLVLEDTPSDAELTLRELKRASIDVTARLVDTEDGFRRQLTEWHVDVILADYSLPSFDGAAALRIAREIAPEVPFIFVSGSIGEERAVLALHDGATDYILKDRMSRLGPAVVRALDEQKQRELRRASQEALIESETRFRSVAESAGDGIVVTDGEGTVVFANARAGRIFGASAAELMGHSVTVLQAEEGRTAYLHAMELLRKDTDTLPAPHTIRIRGLRHDGTRFPLEMSLSRWHRDYDDQFFFSTIIRDISERVEEEQRQRTQAARLREAQQLAHVGSWEYEVATGTTTWSEEVYAILGISPDLESSGERYREAMHPADRDPVEALLESHIRLGSPETIRFQHRVVRPDGDERVLECRSRIVADGQGVVTGTIGTIQDITEQTAAARTIAELSRRSQLILDCAAEGIIGIRTDTNIGFTNPAALALLGRSREELLACHDIHALFHHSKRDGTPYPEAECPITMTLRDGRKRVVTGENFWRADGEPFAVEYESAPIVEDGTLLGCVLTFRDVTESQAMERKLELAKRIGSLGRVAATIAHEFNNVMMGIAPFAEMIRARASSDKKIDHATEQILTSLRRGRRVTEEILRFTQPAGIDLRGVDLREWLDNLGPELRALAGPAVRVVISLPDEPLHIACDSAQLQQVVTNLLLNARDASPESGQISISLARLGGDRVELTVRDRGNGIPPAALEHIFEPLFTTKRTGTGLGLSVARQIVTQHGGSIDVSNAATGGAEFRVVLPATKAELAAVPPASTHRAERRVERLLLVEDDELVASGLTALLEMEGIAVRVVTRGLAVVEAVESFEPEAVILDLTLPDIDGMEVFHRLQKRWPRLPIVFSTGHGGEIELERHANGARIELLRKPYEIFELLAALERVVAG